jgi:hypothetical protein
MSEPIDFERAQFATPDASAIVCQACQRRPDAPYFALNGHSICAACLEQARAAQKGSFLLALLFGTVAGAVSALVYYGIRELSGYDLALITILLGSAVGIGVRRGAGGRANVIYRLMAVTLAWLAMTSTYIPAVAEAYRAQAAAEEAAAPEESTGDSAPDLTPEEKAAIRTATVWITSTVWALLLPVVFVTEGELIGLIIFGVGLWEAWSRSGAPPFTVAGPFSAAAPPTPASS